ncbi:MAG: hypothetical protein R3C20_18960 [Planctomycetaceae bacterium]
MPINRTKCVASALAVAAVCFSWAVMAEDPVSVKQRVAQYAPVRLSADLSGLSDKERDTIRLLIQAAEQMDHIFWREAWGHRKQLMERIQDPAVRRFAEINYGPWDRLGANASFVEGIGPKPLGANFYPKDMTKEEFEAWVESHPDQAKAFRSLYTIVRRTKDGKLRTIPYHKFFADRTQIAAEKLRAAAELAEDEKWKTYLTLRADALLSDDFQPSDLAWMDMKSNTLDIVIGPIENYEDRMFGYKAAHEAYVLIKDREWSGRLSKYASLLPELQKSLPVSEEFKSESPGTDSDLNAYDVVYYAGDCNSGSKTIAINLPNDEEVQLKKGTRRLQLKNAMRAKFDRIVEPIADELLDPAQREHVTFDAFFSNTMLHEVAHGLGIKNVVAGSGTVRQALRELGAPLEECKADILGLYLASELRKRNVLTEGTLRDNYVTYMAGIFRSSRFGATSAHGRANMISFNFFQKHGAFTRGENGRYRVDFDRMESAIQALTELLLTTQGNGRYEGAAEVLDTFAVVGQQLQADLDRLRDANIPVDVVFEQGLQVLGLD